MTTETHDTSLRASIGGLINSLSSTLNKFITLFMLEGRLAGISLINIIGLALIACFLIFTAWLSLMFAIITLLMWYGFQLITALLITAVINLFLLIPVLGLMTRYYRNLRFSATRRQLEITKVETKGLIS